ncbi:hypothetical protein Q5752_001688 [Cryptotrichosporon argae]
MLGKTTAVLSATLIGLTAVKAGSTPLLRTYSGSTFFDNWTYYGNYDNTTEGDAIFVNASTASASPELTYINDAGNAIIRVDNVSTVAYNYKRDTVKILSQETVPVGSVVVFDATHLPYGCSVWPAWWMYDTQVTWPEGGEIDIIEGVNLQTSNQMALHTESGCSITTSTTAYTGIVNDTSCYYEDNDNSGCGITVSNTKSYGAAFAENGGGVFVTELNDDAISIWFFERQDVPAAITNATDSIDTSSFGTPAGLWASDNCDISTLFGPQTLVLDITLCGTWAGEASVLNETGCPIDSSSTCYETYVLDASNYDNAYFEIASIKVYSNSTSSTSTSSSSAASSSSSSTPSSTSASRKLTSSHVASATAAAASLAASATSAGARLTVGAVAVGGALLMLATL